MQTAANEYCNAAIRRLGYQLGVQLAQKPQGSVTVYPNVLDPLGAQPSQVPLSRTLLCNAIASLGVFGMMSF
jgi:hypothetical protein